MDKALSQTIKARIDPELRDWVGAYAAKMDRSEGSIVRLALRDYRAKVTRRKDG